MQVLPIDGIGGVETAARSALQPVAGMIFALAPMAGSTPTDASYNVLGPRYRSPNDPRAVVETVRRILAFDPDVVIGSLWRSVPVLLLLKMWRPRMRIVYFLHLDRPMHLPDRILSAIGIAIADAIWCDLTVTQTARLSPAQRTRSRIISFVTDHVTPAAQHEPAPAFTIWARLNHQKGIDRAIDLIAALVARGIDARFTVYGPDGGARGGLERQVEQAGLGDHVTFAGPIAPEQRAAVADQATFFLQLSRAEGMAMSVAEAMQLGLVPLVTAVGEPASYVRDGINGLIVDAGAIDAAADRIAALLQDRDRIAEMRTAAVSTWQRAPLYREDLAVGARALCGTSR